MPDSSASAIKRPRFFARDRCGPLRLTPFASRLTGSAPTVFDGPGCLTFSGRVPKFLLGGHRLPWAALNPYCGARLAWSTLTPGPMVLETETFFK